MAELFGFLGDFGGGIGSSLMILVYALPVILIFAFVIMTIRSKSIYKYPVRIFKVRENGNVIELNRKGGYIGRRNSAPFFRIKTGRWWWQQVDLNKTPNPAFLDEQDRVYYKQIDVDTYIQMKRVFPNPHPKNTIELNPIEPDIKYGAILSIQKIKEVLRVESTWKKVLPYAGLILMAVVFIVAYAMLMNSCGG